MGEVLSQNEIDDLLKALSTGELDTDEYSDKKEQQVKNYDFARPSKFSKEHLRTLEIIFEHYARLLYSNLPAYLRKNVQVEVMSSEAIAYSEFSNALSGPVLLSSIDFSPMQGNIIMEMSPSLAFAMIDRLLGGAGHSMERKREFSEIEIIIIERILTICVDLLREPWKNVETIHPRLERIETNAQFSQVISPNEMVALITINIKVGDAEGLLNMCFPYTCLEPVIDKLNTKYWYSNMQQKDEKSYEVAIQSLISKGQIPIRAVLGKSRISVNDFVNLQQGDIIKLNSDIHNELDVFVGNIKKFKALPGSASDNYAVRVTSIIRED